MLAEIKEQQTINDKIVPLITLTDPKGDADFDIASELVQLGHAGFTKASLRRPDAKKKNKVVERPPTPTEKALS